MRMYLILVGIFMCMFIGCTIENIEEETEDDVEFIIPENPYIGPLAAKWDLRLLPVLFQYGLTLDGIPTSHGASALKLYSNWDLSLTIIEIDGYEDCIASGYWILESTGIFSFKITETTNADIINLGIIEANYIYGSDPQALFVEYMTDMGLLVSMDCIK